MATPSPLPDWLEEMRQAEKPSAASAKPAPPPPTPGKTATTAEPFAINLTGIPLDWLDDIRQIEESLSRRPTTTQPPKGPSAAPPQPLPAPPQLPTMPQQRGYDPETGQILDPAAYERWQKAEAQRRQEELQKQPTVSVAEAFLDAQRAIQAWVDDDANKPLVTSGELESIRQCGSIQEILSRYESYGPVMQEKLLKRLAFLVDNRKKFFKAFDTK
jgi:hypothetical protein